MLTVKIINTENYETIIEASCVEFFPTAPNRDTDAGIIISLPDGTTSHYGESSDTKETKVYVMNREGATVAFYRI